MKTWKWLLPALLIFATAACCPCKKSKSPQIPLAETEWKLTQLHGQSVASENYRMTLSKEGTISGIGDCNRFSGTYATNDGKLEISRNMAVTRMMCPNQEREDRFLNMLFEADAYSIDGKNLMLIRNGNVLAVFSPSGNTK